jgi:hypothetical protein
LLVFKGLAPFSFRRFHGLFVFNDLAPCSFAVSLRPELASGRRSVDFDITEIISAPFQLVKDLFGAAAPAGRKIAPRQWLAVVSRIGI